MREKKGKLPAQHSGVISALFSLFLILFRIVVDYSNLPDKYKHLLVSDEIRREGDLLERRVNELSHTVQHIKAPNTIRYNNVILEGQLRVTRYIEIREARKVTSKRKSGHWQLSLTDDETATCVLYSRPHHVNKYRALITFVPKFTRYEIKNRILLTI